MLTFTRYAGQCWHAKTGVKRPSFAFCNTRDEVGVLVEALRRIGLQR